MPVMTRLIRIAKSPQSRRALAAAVAYAQSPQGRARIEQVRRQVAARAEKRRKR